MQDHYSGAEPQPVDTAVSNPDDSGATYVPPFLEIRHPWLLERAMNSWPRLNGTVYLVYITLAGYCNEDFRCNPSILWLRDMCHFVSETPVKSAIRELVVLGKVVVHKHPTSKGRETNEYELPGLSDDDARFLRPRNAPTAQPLMEARIEMERESWRQREQYLLHRIAELEARTNGHYLPEDEAQSHVVPLGSVESVAELAEKIAQSHDVILGYENPHTEVDALFDKWYDNGLSRASSPTGRGWENRPHARNHYRKNPDELRGQVKDLQADIEVQEAKAREKEDAREGGRLLAAARMATVPRRSPGGGDAAAFELWEAVLEALQAELPRPTFETWLLPTQGYALDDDRLELLVRTAFAAEWLHNRVFFTLQRTLEKVAGRPLRLELVVRESQDVENLEE